MTRDCVDQSVPPARECDQLFWGSISPLRERNRRHEEENFMLVSAT